MKQLTWITVFASALALGACDSAEESESASGQSDGGSSAGGAQADGGDMGVGGAPAAATDCAALCDARASLNCGATAAECVSACSGTFEVAEWCGVESEGVVGCLAAIPAADLRCEEGRSEPPDGACDAEMTEYLSCWWAGPDELGDLTSACASVCAGQAALACASATCESDCMAELAEGEPCRGVAATLTECLADDASVSWQCSMGVATLAATACEGQFGSAFACEFSTF